MYRTCILDGKWSFWHSLLWSFSYFLKLFWSCIVSKSPTFRNSIMSGICSPSRPAMDPMPAVHSSQVHSLMMSLCLAQAPRAPQMEFASKKTGYTAKPTTAQWTVRTASQRAGSSAVGQRAAISTSAWWARLSSVCNLSESLAREKFDYTLSILPTFMT